MIQVHVHIYAELLPIRKYRILLTEVCQYAEVYCMQVYIHVFNKYLNTAITMAGMYAFRAVANL